MAWIIAIVALSLVMTALTFAELRQPVGANVLPRLTVGDRVIAVFVLVTFTVGLVNGLMLLAVKTLP